MKIPPKKPHFFKPLQKGFKHGLKIPTGFLKYLKGQDQIEHAVLRKGVKNWLVKVNGGRFEAGWAAFVEEHDLQLGDLLIFRHEGDMEFKVSIFDSSHCNREYAEYLQEEEGSDNVEEISKNFKLKDAGTHNPCDQSHFECTVKPYCISNGYLRLPKEFAMENNLINKKRCLIIRDERQRSWNLRLATHDSRVHIFGGWSKFRIANDLKEGDYMMFEVIADGEKPIWKFHDKPTSNVVSTRKVFPKEESATHSSFGQSHFVCIVRPYCLSKNHLYLPKRFARENGLINKKCDLVISDERQRSWNLKLNTYNHGVYIREGWHGLCVDNDLKEGDCIKFEVVTNGRKPIWKFHGASNHKPFGQSHFVCIVRRYCLVNDFLVIPTKFELANGLSNKRCDLIIRDERERSWNVKLRSSGNRVCIRGGWDEFRDANFLKKGDCIMFEVVSNGNTPIWKYNGKFWGGCQTSQKTLTKQYEAVGDGKGN